MADLEKAKRVAEVLYQYNDYETSKLIKELIAEIEYWREQEKSAQRIIPQKD